MTGWILGQLLPYIIGGLGAIAAVFFYGRKKENQGRQKERQDMQARDRLAARKVKEDIDAIDNDTSAVERLREAGRLRD